LLIGIKIILAGLLSTFCAYVFSSQAKDKRPL